MCYLQDFKMKKKNKNFGIISEAVSMILILIISTFAFSFLIADLKPARAQEYSVCCEKNKNGAYCVNDLPENCDPSYSTTPTSCDATSFCKLGCCYDSQEGTCAENTPRKVCEMKNGTFSEDAKCNIPQCRKGCCVLGDEASLTTLVRCKKLASYYGLNVDFRPDIQNELDCITIAKAADKGACVFEKDFVKTCKFTTREECKKITGSDSNFYKDYCYINADGNGNGG
jgi:hypothetical protein